MADHALWSASATERNWACSGALALTKDLPEQSGEAADWGTVCHEISQLCLRDNRQADEFIGQTMKGKVHEFEVDEEMAETAQIYIDYCRGLIAKYKAETGKNPIIFVEEYLTLDALKPPFDAGGTGDFVAIFPAWKMIEVVDLKTGRGVIVEVKGNPQARSYALGAMLKHKGHDITQVRSTIVQSRAAHKDGRTRSETYHIADLVEWTGDLMEAMRASFMAADTLPENSIYVTQSVDEETGKTFDVINSRVPDTWAKAYLKAGPHCDKTFCKARGFCPALKREVEDKVGLWFDDGNQAHLANNPTPDDPAGLARDLDAIDMIEAWCKSRREHAHRLAEGGTTIADPVSGSTYILVPKQGREKWSEGVEDKVLSAVQSAGLPVAKYLNPGKLKTPKQIRKELGANAKLVADLSIIPDAGTNLVRADKTTRDAVPGTATRYFEPSTEQKD